LQEDVKNPGSREITLLALPPSPCRRFIRLEGKGNLMVSYAPTLASFVIALIISTVIIYVITKVFGEKEGLLTALLAAIVGSVIYALVYYFLGNGMIAAIIAGIFWLVALQMFYKIGWIKSLVIAVIIWIVASIVGLFLPTIGVPV
jgi:ABC-type multidrug transport system permease subunit